MTDLKERLKKLGLTSARDIPTPSKPVKTPLEVILDGKRVPTIHGDVIVIERFYPYGTMYGNLTLRKPETINELQKFAGRDINIRNPETQVFIDTETTGLSGGTGTFPFLIGLGYFDIYGFKTYQLLLENPIDELAQLVEFSRIISGFQGTVTFNGKSFDLPLLRTRFLINKLEYPLDSFMHIDLLHLSRRLWKARLVDRSLKELETHIINYSRSCDEVPGWMIPQIYFDYLRSGDGLPLRSVAYHNEIDVVSMAALMIIIDDLLEETQKSEGIESVDIYSMAVMYAQIGEIQKALTLFETSLNSKDLPVYLQLDCHLRMADILKRNLDFDSAIEHWIIAAGFGNFDSCIELSKCFEHKKENLKEALFWANKAEELLILNPLPKYRKNNIVRELNVRKSRIMRSNQNVQEKD